MAPPLQVNGAAILKLYWTLQSQLAVNVLGIAVVGTPTFNQALADQIGTAVKGAATTHLGPLLAANVSLARVGIRDIRQPGLPEFRDTGAGAIMAGTGDPLPRSTALCVTSRTAKAGKRYRGRTYIGGFTETQNDTSANTATAASSGCTAFMAAVNTALIPLGIRLGVVSRPAERTIITKTTTHSDGTTTSETISDIQARSGEVNQTVAWEARTNTWESQRRRDNGRGGALASALSAVSTVRAEP